MNEPEEALIQVVDAGPGVRPVEAGEDAVLGRLERSLARARGSRSAMEVLVALADLVSGLVPADALTLHLRGAASTQGSRILVHRGLRAEEVAPLAREAAAEVPEAPRFDRRLSVPISGDGVPAGRLTLWRTARDFDARDRARTQLAATSVAVLVHQFLRRVKDEQRVEWNAAVQEVNDALAGRTPTTAVLQTALDRVCDVADCDLAWLVTGMVGHRSLCLLSGAEVTDAARARAQDLPTPLTTSVMESGESLRVGDITSVSTRGHLDEATWGLLGPGWVEPVRIDGQVVGGLGMVWRTDRTAAYLSLDPGLPPRFAELAALVMRLGRARSDAERLAVLEERDRIRLDLHDRVIQRLYALGMGLESARLRTDPVSVQAVLDHAVVSIDEAITGIRRTIAGLGVADEGVGLFDAMTTVVDKAAAEAPFRPELRVVGLARHRVAPDVHDDLLAVLEEGLSNVARHAGATRCRAVLEVDGDVTLVIEDDGVGVPEGVAGSGLANLRHRAASHGGELSIMTLAPGTRLTWSVPHPPGSGEPSSDRG